MGEFYFLSVSAGKGADDKMADDVLKKLKLTLNSHALAKNAFAMRCVSGLDCTGVVVQVFPGALVYQNVTAETVPAILDEIAQKGYPQKVDQTMLIQTLSDNLKYTIQRICGKCCPCRLGAPNLLKLLQELPTKGNNVLPEIQKVAYAMQQASMCAVGMFGADAVLFALKNFWSEVA